MRVQKKYKAALHSTEFSRRIPTNYQAQWYIHKKSNADHWDQIKVSGKKPEKELAFDQI